MTYKDAFLRLLQAIQKEVESIPLDPPTEEEFSIFKKLEEWEQALSNAETKEDRDRILKKDDGRRWELYLRTQTFDARRKCLDLIRTLRNEPKWDQKLDPCQLAIIAFQIGYFAGETAAMPFSVHPEFVRLWQSLQGSRHRKVGHDEDIKRREWDDRIKAFRDAAAKRVKEGFDGSGAKLCQNLLNRPEFKDLRINSIPISEKRKELPTGEDSLLDPAKVKRRRLEDICRKEIKSYRASIEPQPIK